LTYTLKFSAGVWWARIASSDNATAELSDQSCFDGVVMMHPFKVLPA
jgi:hypothetical protein